MRRPLRHISFRVIQRCNERRKGIGIEAIRRSQPFHRGKALLTPSVFEFLNESCSVRFHRTVDIRMFPALQVNAGARALLK